jgi:hypothetical protein
MVTHGTTAPPVTSAVVPGGARCLSSMLIPLCACHRERRAASVSALVVPVAYPVATTCGNGALHLVTAPPAVFFAAERPQVVAVPATDSSLTHTMAAMGCRAYGAAPARRYAQPAPSRVVLRARPARAGRHVTPALPVCRAPPACPCGRQRGRLARPCCWPLFAPLRAPRGTLVHPPIGLAGSLPRCFR